jgi:hypothetical protein
MMKLRMMMGIAALGLLAACSGSAGGADKAKAASRTEETAAAELLHGLLDRDTDSRFWIEQTATSPATFTIHQGGDDDVTITVSKVDTCKYRSKIVARGQPHFTIEVTEDLNGLNPSEFAGVPNQPFRILAGAKLSCKVLDGEASPYCEGTSAPSGSLSMSGIDAVRFQQLGKEFKQDYCQ